MVETLTPAASERTEEPDQPPSRRGVLLATAAAVVPILVAGIRGAVTGWIPTGDNGYVAIRAWDVFTSHPPLLGTWSSASTAERQINHPGPLLFDLLAVPVRTLGRGPGTAIGMALINAVAVALIAWLVHRRAGAIGAATAMGAAALLAWSLGSEILYTPWNLFSALLPFALFVVAVWCVASGDLVALPILAGAGSLALEIHLSYVILVPVFVAFALAALVVRLRAGEISRGAVLRWGALALVVGLLCWAQPLKQQVAGPWDGNMTDLVHNSDSGAETPDLPTTIRVVGGTLAVPPMWLPPSFGNPSFELDGSGLPVPLCAGALAALTAVLAFLGRRAHRRGATFLASGCVTSLVGILLSVATVWKMPLKLGLVATYLRFLWPLGMVVWLVVTLCVLDEIRNRWPGSARRLVVPGIALALVAGCAALPRVDNGAANPPWTVDAVDGIEDQLVKGLDGKGAVVVEFESHFTVNWLGPPIMGVLQDACIPFYVIHDGVARQIGADRVYHPGDAHWRLVVKGGSGQVAAQGESPETLIARWSQHLTPSQKSELDDLTTRFRNTVAEHGVALADDAEASLKKLHEEHLVDEVADARSRPDETLESPAFADLSDHLDPRLFPPDDVARWKKLRQIRDERTVGVYLSRL